MKDFVLNDINIEYLYPSGLIVSQEPKTIQTILGSCVAICLYDQKSHIGGINHYMLPYWNGEGLASPKYGNIAITKLYEKMLILSGTPNGIVAKIFGGGEVIEVSSGLFNVGKRNINIAYEMLSKFGVPVIAQSTGGKLGRKIFFETATGKVIQKYIKS